MILGGLDQHLPLRRLELLGVNCDLDHLLADGRFDALTGEVGQESGTL